MASSAILKSVDLKAEIAKFDPHVPAGRRAEILVKEPDIRVVLTSMTSGTETQAHSVPGTITVQALEGSFIVNAGGGEHGLPAGGFLALRGGVEHSVRCVADGAFLLTISRTA